ncbi:transcriptional regulator LldR [Comamonas faecalis]|uniref:Transcriptional regulator LldR n=1 Tax=Comamonas faecalis TaxID=1387849 RepID=A0ABP7S0W5_9BURK
MRLADHVLDKLLTLVQTLQLRPGQRLPAERRLAEQLGVSRTSVREAIQKLISQGVLAARRGDGTYLQAPATAQWLQGAVAPLVGLMNADPHYRYDVLEARQALEASTAALAAQRATPEDKARIRQQFDIMLRHQQDGDAEQAARADAQFHLAIAEASHNLVLVQVMHSLFSVVLSTVERNRSAMFRLSAPSTQHALTEQHAALMQAIDDGDATRARQCIAAHLDYVHASIQRLDEDLARRERAQRLHHEPALAPAHLPESTRQESTP